MQPSQPVSDANAPVTLFAKPDKKQIAVFLKNSGDLPFRGTVRYFLEQPDGTRQGGLCDEVTAPPQSETQLIFFDRREIREKRELLRMILSDDAGNEVCRAFWQSEKLRPRRLRDPQLQTTVFLRAGSVFVTVRAERFAPRVMLLCPDCTFSENGFPLFAGEEKTVEAQGAKADFAGEITVRCVYD